MLGGAGATVVGSFLDGVNGSTAWSNNAFTTVKLVPLYAIAVGGLVALVRFGRADLAGHVAGFAWPQIYIALGLFGCAMSVAWIFAAADPGDGLYVMAIGCAVMTVGAALVERGRAKYERVLVSVPSIARKTLTRPSIVILAAGALIVVGSVLAFWTIEGSGFSVSLSAWNDDLPFYPVTIVPVACGVLMALHVLLSSVLKAPLPRRVGSFSWNQVHVALGFQAAVMMLAFLLEDRVLADFGVGFYLMLIAGIALAIGAVMRNREVVLP